MRNRRGLIFLGLAVVMGLIAAWITKEFAPGSAQANIAAIKTTSVVVVRSDVPIASSLTSAQLKLVDWPSEHVPRPGPSCRSKASLKSQWITSIRS